MFYGCMVLDDGDGVQHQSIPGIKSIFLGLKNQCLATPRFPRWLQTCFAMESGKTKTTTICRFLAASARLQFQRAFQCWGAGVQRSSSLSVPSWWATFLGIRRSPKTVHQVVSSGVVGWSIGSLPLIESTVCDTVSPDNKPSCLLYKVPRSARK